MSQERKQSETICISFSGVDGSGKSTQIEALRTWAEGMGLRVSMMRFWDDVARLTGLRETSGHKIFKGDKGIGSPDRPINRRDKNVRSWPMSCVRLFIYTLDAISSRLAMYRARRCDADIFIFDRYLYDELANLTLSNPVMRVYARIMTALASRPDVSLVLDAEPEAARARKPEYPVEFIHINRRAYFDLSRVLGDMSLIPPMPIDDVKSAIRALVSAKLSEKTPGAEMFATSNVESATMEEGNGTLSQPAA